MAPKVPSLYSALTVGSEYANNSRVYGTHTNSYILNHHDVIEIVLNNGDDGAHPFHLHGHNFQLVHRSEEDAGIFIDGEDVKLPKTPMRRDTVVVKGNGNIVIRFRADNPGVWLFHCHIEWHMDQGLIATMIEAPLQLQDMKVPTDHLDACRAAQVPTGGNAAGNKRNVLDLAGENSPPPPLPAGFTTKGYIALIASCASAFLGLATIAWYGTIDMSKKQT